MVSYEFHLYARVDSPPPPVLEQDKKKAKKSKKEKKEKRDRGKDTHKDRHQQGGGGRESGSSKQDKSQDAPRKQPVESEDEDGQVVPSKAAGPSSKRQRVEGQAEDGGDPLAAVEGVVGDEGKKAGENGGGAMSS